MRPLRAPRATIVPVPALVARKAAADPKVDVDQKVDADPKADVDRKTDVAPKVGAARKTDAVLKVDAVPKTAAVPKTDAARKTDAVLKTGAVQTVAAVPDDVRSQEWSSLSVRQFPAARLTRRGSHLQAFQFGRLRLQSQDHVAVLVAKAPMVPAADLADQVASAGPADPAVQAAVRLHVVIANRATCANRVRHTSKFFTSSACFSM